MTSVRVGLVTEGPTDQIVIKFLLFEYFSTMMPNCNLTFIDLQPTADRTSGEVEGGWEMVYKWCLNNPPTARLGQFFGPGLFANGLSAKACDLIVVHMDADICVSIPRRIMGVTVPAALSSPAERGSFIEMVLHDWLWPDGADPDHRHIEAPAVEAIEAWLVAGLGDSSVGETLGDPMAALAELHFALRKIAKPAGARRIKKDRKRYAFLSAKAAERVSEIAAGCEWFGSLTEKLRAQIERLNA